MINSINGCTSITSTNYEELTIPTNVPRPIAQTPRQQFKDQYQFACSVKLKQAKYRKLSDDPTKAQSFKEFLETNYHTLEGPQKVFAEKVKRFSEGLEKHPTTYNKHYLTNLRKKIVSLSKDPIYIENKDKNDPVVNYLQLCAIKMESVDGTEILKDYGHAMISKYLPPGKSTYSYQEFMTAVDSARKDKASQSSKDGWRSLPWILGHILKFFHCLTATWRGLSYESYKGNSVFGGPDFEAEGKRLHHKHCPGITGTKDSFAEHLLIPGLEKLGLRWVHINNQNGHLHDGSKPEPKRVAEVHRWGNDYPDQFSHALISYDTPSSTGKHLFEQFIEGQLKTPHDFFDAYKAHIMDGIRELRPPGQTHGIVIPESVLNDEELTAAFDAARAMVCEEEPTSRENTAKAIDRTIAQVLEWTIMKKELLKGAQNQQTDPDLKYSWFSMACKENIDRGPMENAGLVINDHLANNKTELTADEVLIYGGIMLGRSDYSMDRAFLNKRFKPFANRVEMVEKTKQTAVTALQNLQQTLQT